MNHFASVLIVEDDDFYREYLGELLKSRGLGVDELTDGSTVCERVAERPPDLMILDLFMTGRDGLSITRELKQNPKTLHIPIIILTGSVEHSDLIRCLEAGADDFINKNCKGYELFLRINAHLRVKRLHDTMRAQRDNLNAILDVTRTASSSLDYKTILDAIVLKLLQLSRLERCLVIQVSPETGQALVLVSSEDEGIFEQPIDLTDYPEISHVVTERLPLVQDRENGAIAVVPLHSGGDFLGVLYLRSSGPIGENDIKVCSGIADSMANVLKNAQLYIQVLAEKKRLEKAYEQKYLELEETNRKLAEAIRLKDDFLSICSHDIKSPLHIMIGHANLLLSGKMGEMNETQTRSMSAVRRQGNRVIKMVDDLLELRKIEDERFELTLVRGHLNRNLMECCENIEPAAREREVSLQFRPDEDIAVNADWVLLREMVENLLQNAVKFSPPGSTITVSVSPTDGRAVVEVKDEGIGIATEDLERIFDRFYTTRRTGIKRGSGLGLAIVKTIAERHGGYLTVESELEKGSTFRIHLPISDPEDYTPAVESDSEGRPRYRILTIDDEQDARELITVFLDKKFELYFAEDGMVGMIKAREVRPDLILMDLNMPRLNGMEATRRLKSNDMTKSIPIIIVSSTRDQQRKLSCFSAGADDFIHKPFEPAELEARIRVHLRD